MNQYYCNMLQTVATFTIIIYDCKLFVVQATGSLLYHYLFHLFLGDFSNQNLISNIAISAENTAPYSQHFIFFVTYELDQ